MKKVIAGVAGLCVAIALAGGIREYIWHQFTPPGIIGDVVEKEKTEEAACEWFEDYAGGLQGWKVPYSYRLAGAQLESVEQLKADDGSENAYVQLDYAVTAASDNYEIVSNLGLIGTGKRREYTGQMVLHLERIGNGTWQITEKLSPVQFQLRTDETQKEAKEPQTEHFTMRTEEECTYYVKDGVLHVTYDAGKNFREVPEGYERVCRTPNGTYDELLAPGSYVVTPEFTAFVGYDGRGAVLLYSTDAGENWKESRIAEVGHRADTFLAKTEHGCYATFAVDRALGNDYYATYRTEDFAAWNRVEIPERLWSNLDCSFWVDDKTGYYGKDSDLYMTGDGGKSFQSVSYPEAEGVAEELGFYPFDTVERIYLENGAVCMLVGQGDDGDYVKDGKLMKALYRSEDGVHFAFVKMVPDDTPELAG